MENSLALQFNHAVDVTTLPSYYGIYFYKHNYYYYYIIFI